MTYLALIPCHNIETNKVEYFKIDVSGIDVRNFKEHANKVLDLDLGIYTILGKSSDYKLIKE